MCWNVALGVMSAVTSYTAQSEAADRQNEAYQQNANTANVDAVEKYAQNQMQQIQEEVKAVREKMANKEATMQAKGTAIAGTENHGSSINSTINDIERQGAKNDDTTNVNLRNAQIQANENRTSIKNENQSRINSMSPAEEPSIIQSAISGLGTYLSYSSSTGGSKTRKATDHGGSTTAK